MNKTQDEHHSDLVKLIDSNPDYQKGGKMRWLVELMGEEMGHEDDWMPSDEGWDEPQNSHQNA